MSDAEPPRSWPATVVGLVVGLPMIAFGVAGAVDNADRTRPFELTRWVIGADLAHDLILAPVVIGVSWCIGRLIPVVAQSPVRWAAATSGVLALVAWPFVRGYGRNATVPSLLDRNYAQGLAVYVGVVWVVAAVWALARSVHQIRDNTTTAEPDSTTA